MDKIQIEFIKKTFGLNSLELSKALGIAPFTMTRWEEGKAVPKGLTAEVLQGLYSVALKKPKPEQVVLIKSCLVLGVGSLISQLLLDFVTFR